MRSGRTTTRAALAALVLGGAATAASAHSHVLGLGEAATATHYFGVICSTEGGYETDHLYLQLQVLTPGAPPVNLQVIKGNNASSSSDTVGGDAAASPAIRHKGGNGLYQVLVNKSGAGVVSFQITAHCLDASGLQHTGTDALVYQYQDR